MRITTSIVSASFVLAAGALIAAPAQADPKGEVFDVVCDNGNTYPIVVNGNGEFTPGLDTSSTTVLVPTSFSGFTFVVTNEAGEVVFFEEDPTTSTKGSSAKKQRATTTTCSFSASETFEDPELGEGVLTGTFSGVVSGFVTPAR